MSEAKWPGSGVIAACVHRIGVPFHERAREVLDAAVAGTGAAPRESRSSVDRLLGGEIGLWD